jgi:hypothetical protein
MYVCKYVCGLIDLGTSLVMSAFVVCVYVCMYVRSLTDLALYMYAHTHTHTHTFINEYTHFSTRNNPRLPQCGILMIKRTHECRMCFPMGAYVASWAPVSAHIQSSKHIHAYHVLY